MKGDRIAQVRASVTHSGGADYHQQLDGHWIDGRIATPMSIYPAYRETRSSWGLNALGTFIVEAEAESGEIGVGVSTGGIPACWIVEHHLARFVEGQQAANLGAMWDQMWRSTLYYGRKGLVVNAISAVDLALWDLLGRLRGEPVYNLIGGAVHEKLPCYATGPRPDLAQQWGFVGGKLPLEYGPANGVGGLQKNVERMQQARELVGDQFFLAYDCWMALDLDYSVRLSHELDDIGLKWLEECLPPDDYWGQAELRAKMPPGMLLTSGEHEWGLQGFRILIDMGCCDIVQPDITWAGGLSEVVRIADYADAHGVQVVPHGSGPYSFHFAVARRTSPFVEFLVMSPKGDALAPTFGSLFNEEPLPVNGQITVPERPGFGLDLNRSLQLERPFGRG